MKSYQYTNNDLLNNEPYHYHYSPFEGKDLLNSYLENRQSWLSRCQKTINQLPKVTNSHIDSNLDLTNFENLSKRKIETAVELDKAVVWINAGGDVSCKNLTVFINSLLKKFEVSKRLRSHYAEGFRIIEQDSAPIDAYCFLAFLISRRISSGDLLWRLNALLKLHDLIISTDIRSATPKAVIVTYKSLTFELKEIQKLVQSNGMELK